MGLTEQELKNISLIQGRGGPGYTYQESIVGYPGGSYTNRLVIWDKTAFLKGEQLVSGAELLAHPNSPNIVLAELARVGYPVQLWPTIVPPLPPEAAPNFFGTPDIDRLGWYQCTTAGAALPEGVKAQLGGLTYVRTSITSWFARAGRWKPLAE